MIAMQDNQETLSLPLFVRGLRELLTSSINLVELAYINEKPSGSPKTLRYLERVGHVQNRMTLLLEQFIFLDEIAGQMKIKSVSLLPLFKQAQDRYMKESFQQQINVTLPPVMPFVMADGYYLSHVIIRLMSNAIIYRSSTQPSIAVRAYTHGEWVRCEIEDNGLGIPPEHQDAIFQMYTRGDRTVHEGLGLGLYTAQTILTHMQGRIGFDSVRGQGSTIWFDLPVAHS